MTHSRVQRWHPIIGLAERPATIFDISWQGGEQRLIATVRYASDAEVDDGVASAVVIFEDVFAFQVLDENMNWSGVEDGDALLSNVGYPYGGCWPFLEFHASDWIEQLTKRDGVWDTADFRHLVITSRNMHLHVACRALSPPHYYSAT